MATDERNILFIKRSNRKTAKIVYKSVFEELATGDNDKEIRFCQEIFRCRCFTNSHTTRIPPLQKF